METQQINWWLEAAKIAIPVITTIAVGWFIARRNETFKNDLARDLHRFQTRDSLLHQMRAEAILEVYALIDELENLLAKVRNAYTDKELMKNDPEFRLKEIDEKLLEINERSNDLGKAFFRRQILFDLTTRELMHKLVNPILQAENSFWRLHLLEKGRRFGETVEWEEFQKASEAILKQIPDLKEQLEIRFTALLDPESSQLSKPR